MVACGTWHVGGVAGVEWSSLWVDVDSGIWWIKCDGSAFVRVRHTRFLNCWFRSWFWTSWATEVIGLCFVSPNRNTSIYLNFTHFTPFTPSLQLCRSLRIGFVRNATAITLPGATIASVAAPRSRKAIIRWIDLFLCEYFLNLFDIYNRFKPLVLLLVLFLQKHVIAILVLNQCQLAKIAGTWEAPSWCYEQSNVTTSRAGQAEGGSFTREKKLRVYKPNKKIAYRMCAGLATSGMPKPRF